MLKKTQLAILLFTILSSCGIEEVTTLPSPADWIGSALLRDSRIMTFNMVALQSGPYKDFVPPVASPPVFRGFDIYYKLYLDNAFVNMTNDASTVSTQGGAYTALEGLGYKKFQSSEVGTMPSPNLDLTDVSQTLPLVITLDFSPLLDNTFSAPDKFADALRPILTVQNDPGTGLVLDTSFPLYRASKDTSAKNQKFSALYDDTLSKATDTDLGAIAKPIDPIPKYEMVIFLVAYGWNFKETPRSEAVALGIIKNIIIKPGP